MGSKCDLQNFYAMLAGMGYVRLNPNRTKGGWYVLIVQHKYQSTFDKSA